MHFKFKNFIAHKAISQKKVKNLKFSDARQVIYNFLPLNFLLNKASKVCRIDRKKLITKDVATLKNRGALVINSKRIESLILHSKKGKSYAEVNEFSESIRYQICLTNGVSVKLSTVKSLVFVLELERISKSLEKPISFHS